MTATLTEAKENLSRGLHALSVVVSGVADRTTKPIIKSAANYLNEISKQVNGVELTSTYSIRHSR